jgi:hypothetical protein
LDVNNERKALALGGGVSGEGAGEGLGGRGTGKRLTKSCEHFVLMSGEGKEKKEGDATKDERTKELILRFKDVCPRSVGSGTGVKIVFFPTGKSYCVPEVLLKITCKKRPMATVFLPSG